MNNKNYGIKRRVDSEEAFNWLTSYSDLVTILMVFFVIMIAPRDHSALKYERSKQALTGKIDQNSLQNTIEELKTFIENKNIPKGIEIIDSGTDVEISLNDRLLFDLGSISIKKESQEVITQLIKILNDLPDYARIAIEGYTDDNPIHSGFIPSNWHLSSLRALSVLEAFEKSGMCKKNCEVRGFGETKPKVLNRDLEGQPIYENQAQNRRVVVRIF